MKKIIYILIGVGFAIAGTAYALPYFQQTQGLIPGQDNRDYIGTTSPSTLRYKGIFGVSGNFTNLTVTGTCVGCGSAGVFTNPFTASYFVATSSSATSTFSGDVYANLISSPYFHATSTTATSTFAGDIKTSNLILSTGKIYPSADSTTAINIAQADGTDFVTFDTTNKRVGIGTTTPSTRLHIVGTATTDVIQTDIGVTLNQVTAPPAPTGAAVAGAGMAVSDYWYSVGYVTALGETGHSPGVKITTTTGNQNVLLNLAVSTDYRVTGRRLYRTLSTVPSSWRYNKGPLLDNTSATYLDALDDSNYTPEVQFQPNTTNRQIYVGASPGFFVDVVGTYLGINAGLGMTSGSYNTFIGNDAGKANTTGTNNTVLGQNAYTFNTSGVDNIAIGLSALNAMTGSSNVGIGRGNLSAAGSKSNNTAIGYSASYGVTTGQGNTSLGSIAGYGTTIGGYNIHLGYFAGRYETTASNQLFIHSLDTTNWQQGRTKSLLYGVMNATVASQSLQVNAGTVTIADGGTGTEKLTNGNFATDATVNWTVPAGSVWDGTNFDVDKTGDGLNPLQQTSAQMVTPLVVGELYSLSYVISNWTVGYITPACAGVTLPVSNAANGTYTAIFTAISTVALTFTPSVTGARYTIDTVSLKKITGGNLTIGGNMRAMGTFNYPVLAAGTATAGTAPLKFTPTGAVLNTTAELGAVEVDATSLYYTATGTLRENIHFGSKGSGTLTAGTTSTITDAIAKTTSVIIIQPTSAAITLLGVYVSTKNNGTFVLTHGVAAGGESFDYLIIN